MTKALSLHLESEESLRRAKERLEISNRQLTAEKELNQRLVKDKIAQARHQKKTIKDLQVIEAEGKNSWFGLCQCVQQICCVVCQIVISEGALVKVQ